MHEMSNQTPDEWLETSPAARYLGVTTRTLHRYEERGLITPKRLPDREDGTPGNRRYKRSDLDALLREVRQSDSTGPVPA